MDVDAGDSQQKNGSRLSKNQKRRLKKKQQQRQGDADASASVAHSESAGAETNGDSAAAPPSVQVEYVAADDVSQLDGEYAELASVFEKFAKPEELTGAAAAEEAARGEAGDAVDRSDAARDDDEDEEAEDKPVSRKQRKLMRRLSVAQLKQLVKRPDVVEAHDVTSSDPRLLVHLKAYKNTVPVPRHWSNKRKYLQGKRGIEKPPFQLPEFIAMTGIAKLREAVAEADEGKTSKAKQRERVRPKMGKVNIDYQVLYNAFFKYQTKPPMSRHGDIYYEGKEFEVKLHEKKPGVLSAELKQALGMMDGAPPPWLINMQRYGPPPSYPTLRIPGLNAPIPKGTSFGFHPGGWGKPPVDELGRPLYGDVFGEREDANAEAAKVDRTRWGEMRAESDEESEAEEEGEEAEEAGDEEDFAADAEEARLEPPPELQDGMSSVVTGIATPDVVNLRKQRGTDTPADQRQLYTVLQQQKAGVGAAVYGSSHRYAVAGKQQEYEVAIDPSELEHLDEDALKQKYEEQVEASAAASTRAEIQEVLDEQARKKRKAGATEAEGKAPKRQKEFKF